MEDPIKELGSHPLQQVRLAFHNTSVVSAVLAKNLSKLTAATTVAELHYRIGEAVEALSSLKTFRKCAVKVKPGDFPDSALVDFDLEDLRWWGLGLSLVGSSEGGRAAFTTLFRNIRQKCDLTRLSWAYKPHTSTTSFEVLHRDQLYSDNWGAQYFYRQGSRELDQSLTEQTYGAGMNYQTKDQKHFWEISRVLRTNSIDLQAASAQTVKSHLPVTMKTSLKYIYKTMQSQETSWGSLGTLFQVANEAGLEDVQFHKLELSMDSFLHLAGRGVSLQLSSMVGVLLPFFGAKHTFANDHFRTRHVKGFKSLGSRLPGDSQGSYGVSGDNLGSEIMAHSELKAYFNTIPWLASKGLLPFLYANFFLPANFNELSFDTLRSQHRMSFGYGLGWKTPIGRLEASFAALTLSRGGDVPASFQILFAY